MPDTLISGSERDAGRQLGRPAATTRIPVRMTDGMDGAASMQSELRDSGRRRRGRGRRARPRAPTGGMDGSARAASHTAQP